jgi:hypothetical protein
VNEPETEKREKCVFNVYVYGFYMQPISNENVMIGQSMQINFNNVDVQQNNIAERLQIGERRKFAGQ